MKYMKKKQTNKNKNKTKLTKINLIEKKKPRNKYIFTLIFWHKSSKQCMNVDCIIEFKQPDLA